MILQFLPACTACFHWARCKQESHLLECILRLFSPPTLPLPASCISVFILITLAGPYRAYQWSTSHLCLYTRRPVAAMEVAIADGTIIHHCSIRWAYCLIVGLDVQPLIFAHALQGLHELGIQGLLEVGSSNLGFTALSRRVLHQEDRKNSFHRQAAVKPESAKLVHPLLHDMPPSFPRKRSRSTIERRLFVSQ